MKPDFTGGDGLSLEDAVIINCPNEFDGVGMEYQYLNQVCGIPDVDWFWKKQRFNLLNGIYHDIIDVELRDGSCRKYYFNISSFMPSPGK